MAKAPFNGVTPVGGARDIEVPEEGPLIVFTNAHLRCPCDPKELQEVFLPSGRSVSCTFCGQVYDLPLVSYRWPPAVIRRK